MAGTSALMALKARSDARLLMEQRAAERRRNVLVLIKDYLASNGYPDSAERLCKEAGGCIAKFEAADNTNISHILMEYENSHTERFGKPPKLVRKKGEGDCALGGSAGSSAAGRRAQRRQAAITALDRKLSEAGPSHTVHGGGGATERYGGSGIGLSQEDNQSHQTEEGDGEEHDLLLDGVTGSAIKQKDPGSLEGSAFWGAPEDRLLKPLPSWDPETRMLAGIIQRDIFQESTGVGWTDIVGLNGPQRLLKEAVVMPLKYPQLFTGLLSPWCGVLLYGPPGNGKTMLAKAVASECGTTFFNISAASIVSKYRGDSEKLVRVLFELARHHSPSTIFIDEIDSIMGQRGSQGESGGEHEGSRRMKTELLIQMDGLAKQSNDGSVFVLAASNLPWELDVALLRRLEKRVMVTMPTLEAREAMIRMHLAGRLHKDVGVAAAAGRMTGYSGADVKLVCKEAAMHPVRKLMSRLEGVGQMTGNNAIDDEPLAMEVTEEHLAAALATTKPSAHKFAGKYTKWGQEYGST